MKAGRGEKLALLVLLGSIAVLGIAMKRQDQEIDRLLERRQEMLALEANLPALPAPGPQTEELMRLRRENQDSSRLKDLAHRLRSSAELDPNDSREKSITELIEENQQLRKHNEALKSLEAASRCVQNLRWLSLAKAQWAATHSDEAPRVMLEELTAYLPDGLIPQCPAGGHYSVNRIGSPPVCSVLGHAVP
jgi:hypothetical protein